MRLEEATITNTEVEREMNHAKGLVKSGNSNAHKRAQKLETRNEQLLDENDKLKLQCIDVLAKETSQNSRIAELEQEALDVHRDEEEESLEGEGMYGRGSPLAFEKGKGGGGRG